MIAMEHMMEAIGRQSWRQAFEKMQLINLTNDLHTDLSELEKLVQERILRGKELAKYCKAASKTALSPLTILKQAVLLHLHLHHAIAFKPQNAIDFTNLLLCRCDSVAQQYGDGEGFQLVENSKCVVTRSQATTREDQVFLGKEVFMVSKIVRPYLCYLQRLVTSFEEFRSLKEQEETGSALVWRLVNLLRSITGIAGNFVMIGRYFMRDYGGAVVLLTSALSKDIVLYMNALNKYVRSQNYALSCYTANVAEVQEYVSVLNELTILNEQLMHIYLGKYFFKALRDLPQPEWINPNSAEFDIIFKVAQRAEQTTNQIKKTAYRP